MASLPDQKPIVWIGNSKDDLVGFPGEVTNAKPLRGFGGAGVLEVVEDHEGDTYRAVYTVRLAGRVYVLHVFQKKSKSGAKSLKAEIDLIRTRLKRAERHHAEWLKEQKASGNG